MCLKSAGGLNLTNLHIWNKAAIAKLAGIWYTNRTNYGSSGFIHTISKANQLILWQYPNKLVGWSGRLWKQGLHWKKFIAIIKMERVPQGKYTHNCWELNREYHGNAWCSLMLQMHGRLLTAERLAKWGLEINAQCVLCQISNETKEHLFLDCKFSERVA